MFLKPIKTILGISDNLQDDVLNTIIDLVQRQLLLKLWGMPDRIPEELQYIIIEVSVARFNRLGSEFVTSQSEEGHTLTWASDDYFSPFMKEITAWNLKHSPEEPSEGMVILI